MIYESAMDRAKEAKVDAMIDAANDRAEQNAREDARWYKKYMDLRAMVERLLDNDDLTELELYINSTTYNPHIDPKQQKLFPTNDTTSPKH